MGGACPCCSSGVIGGCDSRRVSPEDWRPCDSPPGGRQESSATHRQRVLQGRARPGLVVAVAAVLAVAQLLQACAADPRRAQMQLLAGGRRAAPGQAPRQTPTVHAWVSSLVSNACVQSLAAGDACSVPYAAAGRGPLASRSAASSAHAHACMWGVGMQVHACHGRSRPGHAAAVDAALRMQHAIAVRRFWWPRLRAGRGHLQERTVTASHQSQALRPMQSMAWVWAQEDHSGPVRQSSRGRLCAPRRGCHSLLPAPAPSCQVLGGTCRGRVWTSTVDSRLFSWPGPAMSPRAHNCHARLTINIKRCSGLPKRFHEGEARLEAFHQP